MSNIPAIVLQNMADAGSLGAASHLCSEARLRHAGTHLDETDF
jgi:hypothetical protein